ncbi:STAS domain-containing protein [Plantactinospora sp. B5E13]|uniref:STAS domain-containing protein n=1 Tax=unclassified Plantactinospora TaxID=2631981 RepID=UPI00325DC394
MSERTLPPTSGDNAHPARERSGPARNHVDRVDNRSGPADNHVGTAAGPRLATPPLTVRHHLEATGTLDAAGPEARPTSPGKLPVLSAVGEVDLTTAPLLRRSLVHAVEGHDQVCCDLARVTFFSAAGLHALLAAQHRATQTGTRFAVRNAHGITRRILHLANVEDVLGLRY